MREVRIAGCAGLRPVHLHGVHIGAVQRRLVGSRVVCAYGFAEFVLPDHLTPPAHTTTMGRRTRIRETEPASVLVFERSAVHRSEERRVGDECGSKCGSWGTQCY